MKSDPAIGGGERQKTGTWHPGTADRKRGTRQKSRPPSSVSSGKSGFPAKAGYWGHVNSSGEFESASQFPTPPAPLFQFPWAALWTVVRAVAPTAVAAFVGAATALSWQAYVAKPVPAPAAIVQPVVPARAAPVVTPVAVPAVPAVAPVAAAPEPVVAARPPAVMRAKAARASSATARPAPRRRPAPARPIFPPLDGDGVLEPTF